MRNSHVRCCEPVSEKVKREKQEEDPPSRVHPKNETQAIQEGN
jgi:hypothetical protein